jgi:hypothetical protein
MDAVATLERREEGRVPFASRVMIVRGEAAWFAQVLDISPSGCGVFRPDGCVLLEDEIVRLFFYQDGETAAAIVPARVARVSDTGIGIEYHEPQRVPPVHRN